MEEDTAEGGAGRQSATATPSRTPATGRAPHALPSRAPDALASGVHVSSEHRGAHMAIWSEQQHWQGSRWAGHKSTSWRSWLTVAARTMPRRGEVPARASRTHTYTYMYTHIHIHRHTPAPSDIYLSKYPIYIYISICLNILST